MTKATASKLGFSVVVLVGIVFVIRSSIANGQRQENVDDLTAGDLKQWDGRDLKVAGWVATGTIIEKVIDQETHRTFVMHGFAGRKMRVFSTGPKPDTFTNESQVVSTGRIVPASALANEAALLSVALRPDEYVIQANDLSAKCPSRYEGVRPNQQDIKFQARPAATGS
jgi:cytochrome c-type biogenesis protein CcmE